MKSEFKRFKLEKYALITIVFELLGASGLLIGLVYKPILLISSAGLSILMFFGVLVRIKIKDGVLLTLPALFFMLLNVYIFIYTIQLP